MIIEVQYHGVGGLYCARNSLETQVEFSGEVKYQGICLDHVCISKTARNGYRSTMNLPSSVLAKRGY